MDFGNVDVLWTIGVNDPGASVTRGKHYLLIKKFLIKLTISMTVDI